MLLAKFYVADQKLPKAIGAVEAWTKTHPDDFQARNGLAQLYGSAGNLVQAQQQFEWLDAHHPNDPATLNNLAWLYSQKNDPRAQATAEKAFKFAPQSGPIADTLGWILQSHGDTAGALKYLQLAVAASPDDPAIRYHLAVAFAKANQPANARPNLQKVLQSNAATPDIKQQAKTLLAKIGS
jgi:Flp pilus assembly protein TadD